MKKRLEELAKEYAAVIKMIEKVENTKPVDEDLLELLTDLMCAIKLHYSSLSSAVDYLYVEDDDDEEIEEETETEDTEEKEAEELADKLADFLKEIFGDKAIKVKVTRIKADEGE